MYHFWLHFFPFSCISYLFFSYRDEPLTPLFPSYSIVLSLGLCLPYQWYKGFQTSTRKTTFLLSADVTFVCIGYLVLICFLFLFPFAVSFCFLWFRFWSFFFGIGPCSFCLFGSCFHANRNLVIGVRVYLMSTKNRKGLGGCLFFCFTSFFFSFNAL